MARLPKRTSMTMAIIASLALRESVLRYNAMVAPKHGFARPRLIAITAFGKK